MTVSIIIPTLNEETCLAETLHLLRRHRPHEIIVADGGSQDGTCVLARDADLLVQCSPGRAMQMNEGAVQASGDILLFLHADCSLEAGALNEMEHHLRNQTVAGGCFSMTVRAHGRAYRLIDAAASARVRLTGLIYGDQGLFLRRDFFREIGGFPPLQFMEDLFFSMKLRRHGRVIILRSRIYVSPRRWQQTGLVRQTLRNWLLTALAAAGTDPDRLARFYPQVR